MTWLKKVGLALNKGLQIVGVFQPAVEMFYPGAARKVEVVSQDLAQIGEVIAATEAVGAALGLPGTDKLTAAAPAVAQVILRSAVLADKQIADPALFQRGASKVADGMADILNSLKDDLDVLDKTK